MIDRYELRRLDYSLSQEHLDLQTTYRQFFKAHCSHETVRAAEHSGIDENLWQRMCAMGATTMAMPESVGGDAASLVDLSLVAEELGRALAPVPWIDHVCAARLLARIDSTAEAGDTARVVAGKRLVAMDPNVDHHSGSRLLATGAVVDEVIVLDGNDVVKLVFGAYPERVDNIGCLPMAWVDPTTADTRTVIASGSAAVADYQRAVDEWRLLTAAALVGLVEQTMTIGVEFTKTRYTLGVPISTLQGISHPLANISVSVNAGRNLVRRAAWFLDHEPDERPELAAAAFVFMAEEAAKAATIAVHVQGGLGVAAEAASSSYLTRARGWALAGGDPAASARHVAHVLAALAG